MRTAPDLHERHACDTLAKLAGVEEITLDCGPSLFSNRLVHRVYVGDDFEVAENRATSPFSYLDALNDLAESLGFEADGEWYAPALAVAAE